MRIGMQVIVEDYVHSEGIKVLTLLANTFFCAAVAAVAIFAVLKLSFGG
jgi:succinate dehydrogenase / fumarate reductase membrane anchor subunit